ncbi:MAG: hypothetical protein JKX68_02785 [Flavobacteriales bacterium]|nr:hypothetical protein [Flavobacteriales bacterium]
MMNVFYSILTTCFVLFFITSTAQTGDSEIKPEKKVLAQFGITLIDGISELSIPNDFSWSLIPSNGVFASVIERKSFRKGITLSASTSLYKNVHFFSSITYLTMVIECLQKS